MEAAHRACFPDRSRHHQPSWRRSNTQGSSALQPRYASKAKRPRLLPNTKPPGFGLNLPLRRGTHRAEPQSVTNCSQAAAPAWGQAVCHGSCGHSQGWKRAEAKETWGGQVQLSQRQEALQSARCLRACHSSSPDKGKLPWFVHTPSSCQAAIKLCGAMPREEKCYNSLPLFL